MPKATYTDGFVLPLPTRNIAAYRKMAGVGAKIWMEHGALEYREWIAEDPNTAFGVPFSKLAKVKPGETVVLAWITFKSRKHRDQVNAKVMKDPRLAKMPKTMPFEMKRMAYGGFELLVEG